MYTSSAVAWSSRYAYDIQCSWLVFKGIHTTSSAVVWPSRYEYDIQCSCLAIKVCIQHSVQLLGHQGMYTTSSAIGWSSRYTYDIQCSCFGHQGMHTTSCAVAWSSRYVYDILCNCLATVVYKPHPVGWLVIIYKQQWLGKTLNPWIVRVKVLFLACCSMRSGAYIICVI